MGETWLQSLGREDPLEGKGKVPHCSILAWRIPGTVESMGSQRVGHDWATFTDATRRPLRFAVFVPAGACRPSLPGQLPFVVGLELGRLSRLEPSGPECRPREIEVPGEVLGREKVWNLPVEAWWGYIEPVQPTRPGGPDGACACGRLEEAGGWLNRG